MVKKNELKTRFAELIRQQLRARGVTQCSLASKLGVSPAAVCQVLKGCNIPRAPHIDAICEILQFPPAKALELRSLASEIRAGQTNIFSVLNRMLITYREAKGFSLDRLASLTGIPVAELQMLETCPSALPTAQQCYILAEKLGCKPEDIMLASGTPELVEESNKLYNRDNENTLLSVAEPQTVYEPQNEDPFAMLLPELHISLLPKVYTLNAKEQIRRNAPNMVKDDTVPDDCIIVYGPARNFGIAGKGAVRLAIRREVPMTKQFALLYDSAEDRWRFGIMRPYRVFATIEGKEVKYKNTSYIWSVVKMTVNMEVAK